MYELHKVFYFGGLFNFTFNPVFNRLDIVVRNSLDFLYFFVEV